MMKIYNQWLLKKIVSDLKKRSVYPREMTLTSITEGIYAATVNDNIYHNEIMQNSGGLGISDCSDRAVIIALSEYIEWRVFKQYSAENNIKDSTGFAAYPNVFLPNWLSKQRARANALIEAFERFVWASWVDDNCFKHKIFDTIKELQTPLNSKMIKLVNDIQPFKNLVVIQPSVENENNLVFYFIIISLKKGGIVCAGAAGHKKDRQNIIFKILSELFRHNMAAKRLIEEEIECKTHYQKKIKFFATVEGQNISKKLLSRTGKQSIKIPPLKKDQLIDHDLADLYNVFFCQYQNQPEFITGKVNRLCL